MMSLCYFLLRQLLDVVFVSLQALKGTLGFPLVRFEDAVINMYPFTRVHPYETQEIIINDILKHFREVRWTHFY